MFTVGGGSAQRVCTVWWLTCRRMWEQYLVDTFASQTGSTSEYILYRSEQVRPLILG